MSTERDLGGGTCECGERTEWACVECRDRGQVIVFVCQNIVCQHAHENRRCVAKRRTLHDRG